MGNSITKKCSKCKQYKPLGEFSKSKNRADGLSYLCKPCDREKNKKYYLRHKEEVLKRLRKHRADHHDDFLEKLRAWQNANREKVRKSVREWGRRNVEKVRQISKKWNENHKELISERSKRWALANPDKRMLTAEKRRIAKKSNGGIVTAKEWRDLKTKYDNKCLCCCRSDVRLTMDHVIPLSKGGKHSIENIQPLCGSCNSSKHTKIVDYRP